MQFSRPHQCSVCHRVFPMPEDLITHFNVVHLNNPQFPTSSNVPLFAPGPVPALNPHRNPSPGVPARSRFDLTYYRRGYLDNQGRFQRGIPPAAALRPVTPPPPVTPPERSNFLFEQEEEEEDKPKLMDLFPATSSSSEDGGARTLPLLCQLEQQKIPEEDIVMENVEGIDLTLRL